MRRSSASSWNSNATSPDLVFLVEMIPIAVATFAATITSGLPAAPADTPAPAKPVQVVEHRPLAIGVVNRLIFGSGTGLPDAAMLGLEGHWRQAEPAGWFDVAVEGDFLMRRLSPDSQALNGLALLGTFNPQVACVPEWIWLHGALGGGFSLLFSRPASSVDATSAGLHLVAGVGSTLSMPWGFRLAADGGFMSPWTFADWRQSRGSESIPVNTGIVPFTVGGPYARMSLTYDF